MFVFFGYRIPLNTINEMKFTTLKGKMKSRMSEC
jgi:hypothetical protein